MAQSNIAIAFGKIKVATIDAGDKSFLRGQVTAKPEVAEGIALLDPCLDDDLLGIAQAHRPSKAFCPFVFCFEG
jgi:hypothetical protein